MQCKYCTAPPIVHRDSRCLSHLGKEGECPNAPANVKIEARCMLMKKGGMEIAEPDSDGETMSLVNAEYMAGSSTNPVAKKAKVTELGDGASSKRTLDAYLDCTMTLDEENKSNVCLLRFLVHGNIPFSASENPYMLKWVCGFRPSHTPATRYVL
ncbi:hypothetical protein B0H34DRAFT_656142, partial [Crassisporium funariophilum]